MILAAGRGERMRPLTDHTPKPLLSVGGQPLIAWHLTKLAHAGIVNVVINHAWLGEQIVRTLGDGKRWGLQLTFSAESPALETAGGIARALPFLGKEPFLVINGDIWSDWPIERAIELQRELAQHPRRLAHLVLVDNPAHHPEGDFAIDAAGQVHERLSPRLTFAGIGLYQPALFSHVDPDQPAKLAPLLRDAMAQGAVSGEHHTGRWLDVGTPQRLAELDAWLGP